ncbi:MAG: hypothetical protein K0S08_676 [Gammaproteobacteria bacterium]|jgi:hypothetical protein|nr:hypothetical protein [Gammaproteobacteria bacterium]
MLGNAPNNNREFYSRINLSICFFLSFAYYLFLNITDTDLQSQLIRVLVIFLAFYPAYRAARPFIIKLIENLFAKKIFYLFWIACGYALHVMIPPLAQVLSDYNIQLITHAFAVNFSHSQAVLSAAYVLIIWLFVFFVLIPLALGCILVNSEVLDKIIYSPEELVKPIKIRERIANFFNSALPKTYIVISCVGLICLFVGVFNFIAHLPSPYNPVGLLISTVDFMGNVSCESF